MSLYFMVNIRIKDEQEYQLYLDRADDIFSKYNGSYLAVDKKVTVLEGNLRYRLSAAECDTILIKGK